MGDLVKKLQLVDVGKMNELLSLLQKEKNEQEVIRDATAPPERFELLESYKELEESVKKNSPRVANNKINFMRKKRKYNEMLAEKEKKGVVGDGEDAPKPAPNSVAAAKGRVLMFFKKNGISETEKGIKIGGKSYAISYDDLVQDLVRDVRTDNTNLTDFQLKKALTLLKQRGMPAYVIRSKKIKTMYKNLAKAGESSSSHTPSPSSQQQQSVAPHFEGGEQFSPVRESSGILGSLGFGKSSRISKSVHYT